MGTELFIPTEKEAWFLGLGRMQSERVKTQLISRRKPPRTCRGHTPHSSSSRTGIPVSTYGSIFSQPTEMPTNPRILRLLNCLANHFKHQFLLSWGSTMFFKIFSVSSGPRVMSLPFIMRPQGCISAYLKRLAGQGRDRH